MKAIILKPIQAIQRSERAAVLTANALERSARRIERQYKRTVPVAFGELRGQIGAEGPKRDGKLVYWQVGARMSSHAQFVEFGTGPSGGKSALLQEAQLAMAELGYSHGPGNFLPPMQVILAWVRKKGLPDTLAWPIARQIGRAGIPASPALFPAYVAEKPKFIAGVIAANRQALS